MVWGRMYNNGQVCCASKRFLIQKDVVDSFVNKAKARLKKLVVGDPSNKATEISCLLPFFPNDKSQDIYRTSYEVECYQYF